jgi:hypothetical protein
MTLYTVCPKNIHGNVYLIAGQHYPLPPVCNVHICVCLHNAFISCKHLRALTNICHGFPSNIINGSAGKSQFSEEELEGIKSQLISWNLCWIGTSKKLGVEQLLPISAASVHSWKLRNMLFLDRNILNMDGWHARRPMLNKLERETFYLASTTE